jgi:caffeoyl-CoA O-methyltransferase
VLWSGKIIDEAAKDKSTEALRDFNTKVAVDSRVEPLLLPIRDGLFLLRVL